MDKGILGGALLAGLLLAALPAWADEAKVQASARFKEATQISFQTDVEGGWHIADKAPPTSAMLQTCATKPATGPVFCNATVLGASGQRVAASNGTLAPASLSVIYF
ncbi:MAG: hypothetical protein H6922_06420 [Pseudomonadaceae bacterium]|nr:hypothetical protein [Pseudomonadaceae bacterium]